MNVLTDNALFALMEWAVASLKRLEYEEQDTWELDLRVDLLNLIRDIAIALNNASRDEWEVFEEAQDIADRLGEADSSFVYNVMTKSSQ